MEEQDITEKRQSHPKEKSCFLTNLFFCWTLPIFWRGFKTELSVNDLFLSLSNHESGKLGKKLENVWKIELNSENPSLLRALWRVFGVEFVLYGFATLFIECVLKMSQPILIGQLMNIYSISTNEVYFYAFLIVLFTFLTVLSSHSYLFGIQHLGMKIRIAICSLIYRKSLKLSKTETNSGKMVNFLSNDVNRFDLAPMHLHNLWIAFVETLIIICYLYLNMGISSITGIGFLLTFTPIQLVMGKFASIYRLRMATKTDERVRLLNEFLSGIKVIKMYTWEAIFSKTIEQARKLELKQIKLSSNLKALNVSFMIFMNRIGIFLSIITHVLISNNLDAKYVFVISAFYAMLRQALTVYFPYGLTHFSETLVSVKRIENFLLLNEVHKNLEVVYIPQKDGKLLKIDTPTNPETKTSIGIVLKDVSAAWKNDNILKNVDLEIGQNLIAIIGSVGSGKSSLLQLILKELPCQGILQIEGTISYSSQEPWLFSGTIRQNILFGQTINEEKYTTILNICSLTEDLNTFPAGDRTVVGEKGMMLSGGQRARINLARAVYKDADIYLLDDPLSSVDTHVGKHLFEQCITGYLRGKCVVLVTHQLQYLKSVDRIYLVENGSVSAIGDYAELKKTQEKYTKIFKTTQKNIEDIKETTAVKENKENRKSGSVSIQVYISYLKAGKNWIGLLTLLFLFILTQLGASSADYFTAFWVKQQVYTTENCVYIYISIIIFTVIVTLVRSFNFFKFCINVSKNLHSNMYSAITKAPMSFFNSNSSGRILNRFSKDMGSVDEILPVTVMDTIQIAFCVIGVIVVIAIVNPWILIPTVIIMVLFYFFRQFFLATSRSLKRIEATTKSPIFLQIISSIQGLTTIRALGVEKILQENFDNLQNIHSSAFYLFLGCNRAFGFWLDMNCVFYIALVTLIIFLFGNNVNVGDVGLAITQAISLTGLIQWGIRQWSELENQMIAVERILEYTQITKENDCLKNPENVWPSEGKIEFQSVFLKYPENDNFVLNDLNFTIQPGEKIGIIGRTGAGKSSIISAVLRLFNFNGKILIDLIDTREISLKTLRSKISVIPQEPVLFSGTLRFNLDPLSECNDEKLWTILDLVEMKTIISQLSTGLYSEIKEDGSNFSVGQKQLICLARAMIRNNKILLVDEATSNMDQETDTIIQKTLEENFGDCTILTVAHRLNTIMNSDRIMVMDKGCTVEFDHPFILWENNGTFRKFVEETDKNLIKIAENNYRNVQKSQY